MSVTTTSARSNVDLDLIKQAQDQEEEQESRHYYRNRVLFGLLVIASVALNSIFLLNILAGYVMPTPEIDTIRQARSNVVSAAANFSDGFVADIEFENAMIRANINASVATEQLRVENLFRANEGMLMQQQHNQDEARADVIMTVSYLQAWTRVGNIIPYRSNVTEDEMLGFETALSLQNGALLQDLAGESQQLKQSLQARFEYDQQYLANKTAGLIPSVIPTVEGLGEFPEIDLHVSEAVEATRDEVVAALLQLRDGFGQTYTVLRQQLIDAQLGFKELSERYLTLIDAIRGFYRILDRVTLGINFGLIPRIDFADFPEPDFYNVQPIVFPDTSIFLQPLDDYLMLLQTDFELLTEEILGRLHFVLSTNVGNAVNSLINKLSLDDYNPPPIVYERNHKVLSPSEAFLLDAELTANLTSRANLPSPSSFLPDEGSIPDIDFNATELTLEPPIPHFTVFDSIKIDYPDFEEWFWMAVVMIQHIFESIVIGNGAWSAYRALQRGWDYFSGTAVVTPIVDMRTRKEIREALENRSKRKSKFLKPFLSAAFSAPAAWLLAKGVLVVLATLTALAAIMYYANDFVPNCALSNEGTDIGFTIVAGLVYPTALTAGVQRVNLYNRENQRLVAQECQRVISSSILYQQQILQFETSRVQLDISMNQLKNIVELVDMNELCQMHVDACSSDGTGLVDCPLLEDGSLVGNPCDFDFPNMLASDPLVLEAAQFDCRAVPSGRLEVENVTPRLMEELSLEENWCLTEWWMIGSSMKFVYVLASYFFLGYAFGFISGGVHTVFWWLFREEGFKLVTTCNIDGTFTQPDYDEQEARQMSIAEAKVSIARVGIAKIVLGVFIVLCWVAATGAIYYFHLEPVWAEDFLASGGF